jgi:uncharacterized protein (DUF58 family)
VLHPTLLSSIADLDLVAKIVVDGLISGLHRSPFHGYSAEFSQYRQYRPGDDLKHVDWKLLARTDRLYTKQFRETTNMPAAIVLDCSASMDFASAGTPSKFAYARVLAAALCHLISRQGDAVGLLASSGGRPLYLPPKAGRAHLTNLLAHLARLKPAGSWADDRSLAHAADLLKRRGLLLVFSDFYDDEDRTLAELRRAASAGHEIALFQIMTRAEIDFPYRQERRFEDLEAGEVRMVDPVSIARAYRDGVSAFLERWRTEARREGMEHALVTTETPPSEALRSYLLHRRVR